MSSLVLLLFTLVVRVRNEPLGSSLLRFEGAGRDWEEDGVGRGSGRVEESRSGQQGMRDNVDALSLVLCSPPPFFMCATGRRARRVGRIREVEVVGRCGGYWF